MSFSTSLRFNMQLTGSNINLWGDTLNNQVIAMADIAIAGWQVVPITGDHILTTANGMADEARAAFLKFTGALSIFATITLPSVSKSYFVYNATNFPLVITTGAGATLTIDPGDKTRVVCDGANVHTISFGGLDLKAFISASVLAATGTLPAATGNDGKALVVQAGAWAPKLLLTTDLGDYATKVLGTQVALAVAL